jgi:hypothetical protein
LFAGIWNGRNLFENVFNMTALTSHCSHLLGSRDASSLLSVEIQDTNLVPSRNNE